ncbi:MAG: peptide chain release factor N(5)-glutamine methyltransferase [Hyphomicrobiales bacterium]|nr:peptide chain release factor N(5)-glutamine methyltransferase [Hyphomicrobiales bacterium]
MNDRAIDATTRAEALRQMRVAFIEAGLETPDLDARVLLLAALGISVETLVADPDAPLSLDERERVADIAARRLSHVPVARILGRREFWSFDYDLNAATLVPRPETETLAAAVIELVDGAGGRDRPLTIADLGTGSGCILIALLGELPRATGIGVDIAPDAIAAASRNGERAGVADRARFVVGDFAAALSPGIDIVVSNPPYIADGDLLRLAPEVRDHDPHLALDGGADGLDAYRAIIGELARVLAAEGIAALEIGIGQDDDVRSLLRGAGLGDLRTWRDLAGIARVVAGRRAR